MSDKTVLVDGPALPLFTPTGQKRRYNKHTVSAVSQESLETFEPNLVCGYISCNSTPFLTGVTASSEVQHDWILIKKQ